MGVLGGLQCRAMHDPDTRHEWVSVKQAAIYLGTSESDVRRRIRRGELESESLARPGGTLLRVRLPTPDTRQPIESSPAPETHQTAPHDLSALLSVALGPLTEALALERAERQKLAQEIRDLTARAATAEALAAERERELARERQRSLWKPWTW